MSTTYTSKLAWIAPLSSSSLYSPDPFLPQNFVLGKGEQTDFVFMSAATTQRFPIIAIGLVSS